jgi:hypothetical protein
MDFVLSAIIKTFPTINYNLFSTSYQFDNRSTPNGYSPVSPLVRMVDEMLMNLTELRTRIISTMEIELAERGGHRKSYQFLNISKAIITLTRRFDAGNKGYPQ